MSETGATVTERTLAFSAVAEAGTGLMLMIDPALVVALLLGADVSGVGLLLGRCFGISLLALAIACWRTGGGSAAVRGMLVYNGLIALYLAWLGTAGHFGGWLLWPAVVLHAAVALLLIWARRGGQRTKATPQ